MSTRVYVVVILLFASLLASGCSSPGDESKKAVERLYRAMELQDQNAYLDAVLPSNRMQPSAMTALGVLSALSGSLGVGGFGIGVDFGQLFGEMSKMSFQNLTLTVQQEGSNYVLVEARGAVRYPALFMEMPFCDQHDVRQEDGKWYVDVLAPERQERLQRILQQKEAELRASAQSAPPSTGSVEGDLMQALGLLSGGMQMMLDLCE